MGIQRISLESKLSKQQGFLTISSPVQLDSPSFHQCSSLASLPPKAIQNSETWTCLPCMTNYAGYPSSHSLVRWELMTKANRKAQPWAGIFFLF